MTTELLQGLVHGLPRFARHDSWKSLALHDGETDVRRGDTQTPVTARSEATRQSMDQFVPHDDNG